MNDAPDKYRQLKLSVLTAFVVFAFGYAVYSLTYSPTRYLSEDDKEVMNFMVSSPACGFLKERYVALEEDGKIKWDGAIEIIEECERHVIKKRTPFENALIREFSRHYE